MTQEQKELLMEDLCGRVTNGVICSIYREDDEGFGWRDAECKGYFQTNHSYEFYFEDVVAVDNIENIKPYLRPMSSMTEEEKKELGAISCECDSMHKWSVFYKSQDWLNKNMFDYRGLIEMGLALPATKDNV